MANILFTKNIFIVKNDKKSIKELSKKEFNNLTQDEYKKEFLSNIKIEPPKDYLSHHSIANEWSIYRWAEFLKVDSVSLQINKNHISSMLYFKYLLAQNPIEKRVGITFAPKSPQAKGSILYIDDQWNNGWSDIFDKYFSKANNINFNTFKYEYKDKEQNIILNDIKNEVILKMPDIVILDLRLTSSDHNEIQYNQDIELLTGIKVLKIIKEINNGIQVIMITASNQTLILEKLYKYGISGYIKKEHPHDISISTKDNFIKLKTLIDDGLENKYLKNIWNIQQKILSINLFTNNSYNPIKKEVEQIFDILNTNIQNKLSFVMLSIFKVIEILIQDYIEENRENKKRFAYWKGTAEKIKLVKKDEYYPKTLQRDDNNDSTLNKIRIILYERLNIADKNIHDTLTILTDKRNKYIHEKPVSIDKDDILEWFEMIYKILNSHNMSI